MNIVKSETPTKHRPESHLLTLKKSKHTPNISLKPEVNREMDKQHLMVDFYANLSLEKTVG